MNIIKEYLIVLNYFKSIIDDFTKISSIDYNNLFSTLVHEIGNSKNYSSQEEIIKSFFKNNNTYLMDKDFFYKIKIIDINLIIKNSILIFLGTTLDEKGKEIEFVDLIKLIKGKIKETHNFLYLDNLYSDIINDRIIRNTIEHNNHRTEIGNNIPLEHLEIKEELYRIKKYLNINKKKDLEKSLDVTILEILGEYKTDFKIDSEDFENYILRAFSFISILFLIKSELEIKEEFEVIKLMYVEMLNNSIFWDSATKHLTFLYFNRRNDFYKKSLKEIAQIMYPRGNNDENKIIF